MTDRCATCRESFDEPGTGRGRGVAYVSERGPVHFPACLDEADRARLRASLRRLGEDGR